MLRGKTERKVRVKVRGSSSSHILRCQSSDRGQGGARTSVRLVDVVVAAGEGEVGRARADEGVGIAVLAVMVREAVAKQEPGKGTDARLTWKQAGSDLGQMALRRPLSAADRVPGCPGLRLASTPQPLGPRGPACRWRASVSTWMPASSRFLRRMFLTFLARMLPALSVAKPACIRKISAPARRGRKVGSAPFALCGGVRRRRLAHRPTSGRRR